MTYQSDLLNTLSTRGYIHQLTDAAALDALANTSVVPGYIGFDPTAPSLHVGSLVQIMLLRRLQQTGHKPIVLMGGGTGKIGDPSFKEESRQLLTEDRLASNVASIRRIFERFLTFGDGPTDAVMLDNAEWLDALEYIPFLREVGQHFSVNRMLSFDSVKLRLDREQSLSFLEFNYMILQAYDFRELSRRAGCRLQMGGSDQWGNIVNGIELARRMDGTEVFGVTTPLITTADGGKMGKTMAGAVWLHEDQLPTFDYWQFWRNTDDRDVGRFLRLFTDLPLGEIARLEALEGAEINAAKIVLATEATAMCRGRDAAHAAEQAAKRTFEQGSVGEELPSLAAKGPIALVDALVKLNLASSKGEARRLIAQRAIKVDGIVITDVLHAIPENTVARVSRGKRDFGLVLSRTTEADISLAVLQIAANQPNNTVTYEQLYRDIPMFVKLCPIDWQDSMSRGDEPLWHQVVRNIRSHSGVRGNFIQLGLLLPIERIGYQVTEAGLAYLDSHEP